MKHTPIDKTAGRLGAAMWRARHASGFTPDELSRLLRITPDELLSYERAIAEIPTDIMERVLVMGYKMITIRSLEHKYRSQRKVFRKTQQTVASAQ